MLSLLSLLICSLWPASVIDADSLNIQSPSHLHYKGKLHRHNNIDKFGGCDKEYDDPDSGASNPEKRKGKDLVKWLIKMPCEWPSTSTLFFST
jgi:hypothetical protein